jgi:hypothetical protein
MIRVNPSGSTLESTVFNGTWLYGEFLPIDAPVVVPWTVNNSASANSVNSNTSIIGKNSSEKLIAGIQENGAGLLSAKILSANSTAKTTIARASTSANKRIAVVTTGANASSSDSEYAAVLEKLNALATRLDGSTAEMNTAAENATTAIAQQKQDIQDDFAAELSANEKLLADAKKAAGEVKEPDMNEQKTIPIGFSNLDENGNKIYYGYDDVIPLAPIMKDSPGQATNQFVLPIWNYNETIYQQPTATP